MNLDNRLELLLYKRYVDDTFSLHLAKEQSSKFFEELNDLHPALKFSCEQEKDHKLPFLEVNVHKRSPEDEGRTSFETSIYRKPTFTGLYTRWDSFTARRYKINLIKCLANRAVRICSTNYLPAELQQLKQIFSSNGYPRRLVENTLNSVVCPKLKSFGPAKCSISLRFPWKGQRNADMVENSVKKAVSPAFPACEVKVVYSSKPAFQGSVKDNVPAHSQANVIYLFSCRCGARYVGKTTQRLENRIKQHLSSITSRTQTSAIGEHLAKNISCLEGYLKSMFSIVRKARNESVLHVLEALFIRSLKPELCKQMEFVKSLHLV